MEQNVFKTSNHPRHSSIWTIKCKNFDDVLTTKTSTSCVACLVELLEEPSYLIVKKKLVLSEFLRLLQNCDQLPLLITHNYDVLKNTVIILIDLLEVTEENFLALVIEVCLKLLNLAKSDPLTTLVLDFIANQIVNNNSNVEKCLPIIVLLGRLLDTLTDLHKTYYRYYNNTIPCLAASLVHPNTDVQLAALYIVVLLVKDPTIRPSLLTDYQCQLAQAIIVILSSSSSVPLLCNVLEMVRVLLVENSFLQFVVQLRLKGSSLGSAFKSLLQNRKESLQTGTLLCVLELLTRSRSITPAASVLLLEADIAELLFERLYSRNSYHIRLLFQCLTLLSEVPTFFSHFHSVYGIDSIISALNTLQQMNQKKLLVDGLILLRNILQRQPDNITLFNNVNSVKLCLGVLSKMMDYHNRDVLVVTLEAAAYMFKKEHLLLPVPFELLKDLCKALAYHVYSLCKPLLQGRKPSKQAVEEKYSQIITVFHLLLEQACSFCVACEKDPRTCETNYRAPMLKETSESCVKPVEKFAKLLLEITDTCSLPLIMAIGENCLNHELYQKVFSYLNILYKFEHVNMTPQSMKLSASGFLMMMLQLKYKFSYNKTLADLICLFYDKLFQCLFQHYYRISLMEVISTGLRNCFFCLRDIYQEFVQTSEDGTKEFILTLLYFCYINHYECLPIKILFDILDHFISCHVLLKVLPEYLLKSLVFLLAWGSKYSNTGPKFAVSKRSAISLVQLIEEIQPSVWFAKPSDIFLNWSFVELTLTAETSNKVLEYWLNTVSVEDIQFCLKRNAAITSSSSSSSSKNPSHDAEDQTVNEEKEYRGTRDVVPLSLIQCRGFLQALFVQLTNPNEELAKKAILLMNWIITQNQENKNEDCDHHTILLAWLEETASACLHSLLLKHSPLQATSICSILPVVTRFLEKPLVNRSSVFDCKLVYHLVNLSVHLDISNKEHQKMFDRIFCYLTFAVKHVLDSAPNNNNVVSLLIQNEKFLEKLEMVLQNMNEGLLVLKIQVIHLLNQLIKTVPHDTQVVHPVTISFDNISIMYEGHNITARHQVFEFLSSLFQAHFQSAVVRVHFWSSLSAVTKETTNLATTHSKQLRKLYIYLQQDIVKNITTGHSESIQCLLNMLDFLNVNNSCFEQQIMSQPWNHVLLDFLFRVHNLADFSDSLLSLIIKFLDHEDCIELMKYHMNNMLKNAHIMLKFGRIQPERVLMWSLLHKLTNVAMTCDVDESLVLNVKAMMEDSNDSTQ
ncbi:meiosis inhibitor protein 1-like [Octopus sinensis]|uniref:Meiosis inhibitor protein 1-like n=1 Tax=Octopus sinensis TaxID=2607531 RepID=A0A7E6FRN3_9MOLL|nr:meiosis inhibitor protein 1-like [Octopus sinensis]